MALLLAPYNNAMRPGMGFNSFTQQLCIDGAVKMAGGVNATEANLVPANNAGTMEAPEGGNGRTSQVVSWTAKFVDRISEVTDSMNVGGSLEIKCDAVAGGGTISGNFLDSNKFKDSDLNYLIQVKVTNQQLLASSMTEFCPIPNIPPSEFTRVYGDSFISGFIEGGEFTALISIKLNDRSQSKKIAGTLKASMNLKAASVDAEAKGEKDSLNSRIDGETTIAVSWSGGGDIKDDSIKDWTLDNLKAVAMEFPERVMACPLRISAILTKYTALRSFYVKQIQGSPLDYENAGVYSSALLDAYMDYKIIWRNVQTAAWEVEQGLSSLEAKAEIPEMADYAKEANSYYNTQLQRYKNAIQEESEESDDSSSSKAELIEDPDDRSHAIVSAPIRKSRKEPLEPPLPSNNVVPYKPDRFGLDKARRDCRFEMIKIVKEVDAVADNPKVATDPNRAWQFLSPAIFKMLLPRVVNKGAALAVNEIKDAKEEITKTKDELQKTTEELRSVKASLAETQNRLKDSAIALDSLQHEKKAIEERLLPSEPGSRVWISAIIWGDCFIGDQNVMNRCKELAISQQPVPFTNEFFGCDPMFGVKKVGTIAYRYDDKGLIRYLTASEGSCPKFDAWN